MGLTQLKRRWYLRASVAVAVMFTAGLVFQNVERAGAITDCTAGGHAADVNNACVFELDGDVAHEASSTPPYDWSDLFTPVNTAVGAVPVSPAPAGLVDSSFVADTNGTDVAFVQGSSKDGLDSSGWVCTTKPVTPKDEIQNAYAAAFVAPSTSPVSGHVLLYMALERGTVTGTSNAAFWLFKQPTACSIPAGSNTGSFVNPNTGSAAGHSDGDILLFASFTSGGTTASVSEFTWSSSCTTTNQAGCTSTSPTGGLTTAGTTGVNCVGTGGSTLNLCGAFNGTSSITTPWAPKSVGTNGFFEVGMDLTALIPSALSSSCFSTFLADTRSSASVTADLHDFISGNFSLCRPTKLTTSQTPAPSLSGSPGTLTVGSGSTSDTATLSGFIGSVSGEPVNFSLFGPFSTAQTSFNCGASSTAPRVTLTTSTANLGTTTVVSGTNTATTSPPIVSPTLDQVGFYYWVASYGGDRSSGGLNLPSATGCTDEPVQVTPVTPKLSTTAGGTTTIVVGNTATVSDTANITNAFNPSGTVTFELLPGPAAGSMTCGSPVTLTTSTGPATSVSTAFGPVTGTTASVSTPSGVSFTPTTVGSYYWIAKFDSSTANNNSLPFSACPDNPELVTVIKATPTVNTIMFLGDIANITNGFNPGTNGTVTFKLYENPTSAAGTPCAGTVAYELDNVALSSLSASTLNDIATNASKFVNAQLANNNTYSWQVIYNGNAQNNAVTVGCGSVTTGSTGSTATESTGTITQS